ncbi:hypothetical protein [Nonomuraea polychroma]|uniref:hypothetical protein n=1 Tax=Nonomuraea polychroma TaxID=46176 RepID=UPI001F4DA544|nr:hypothetical protein [Nonomuraea polychroma]
MIWVGREIGFASLHERIDTTTPGGGVYLFDGTIEEHVRLGRPGAGVAEVRAAATAARLDEVTSALDPANEAAVHDGIERLMAGRTVVMVAQRMRTVQRADRIVFVDEGRIVEEGSHDEPLRHDGRYADF